MKPFCLGEAIKVMEAEVIPAGVSSDRRSTGRLEEGGLKTPVRGVCTDSRGVQPGDLFFALRGERTDGHLYVGDALQRGAIAAIVESIPNFSHSPTFPFSHSPTLLLRVTSVVEALGRLAQWYRRQFDVTVIGVTGTTGKTSTKEMIAAALQAKGAGSVLKSEGNLNTEIGVPLTLFQLEAQHHILVQEMAMRGRNQVAWLAEIAEPQMGVVTQIGWTHVELLGSRHAIAEAKAELLEKLPPNGVAVLPRDDRYYSFLRSRCRCPVITFGRSREADVRLKVSGFKFQVSSSTPNPTGLVQIGREQVRVCLPVPGVSQLMNAASALAVAHLLDVPLEAAAAELQTVRLPAMRMEFYRHPAGWVLLNDAYNANPDSMREALRTLLSFTPPAPPAFKRRIAVLGDMKELGAYSRRLHRQLGRWLAKHPPDLLVVVGSDMLWTAQAAMEGGLPSERLIHLPEAGAAGRWLAQNVQPGDFVLIKGSRALALEKAVEQVMER